MTEELQSTGDTQEQHVNAAGAGSEACAGREEQGNGTGSDAGPERPRTVKQTVKAKMRRKGHRHKKNAGGVAGKGKQSGQHVPRGTLEAAEILREEGYTVGKVLDPDCPFDLMGWSNGRTIFVRVARPKEFVANARDVMDQYEADVRVMKPYFRSEADNIQFMVFSRMCGLLRYRVYDWGIANVETTRKIMTFPRLFPSDLPVVAPEPANRRARNAPCPDEPIVA